MKSKWSVKAVVVLSGVCAAAGVVIAAPGSGATTAVAGTEDSDHSAHEEHQSELAEVRSVTARFHDLDTALEAGYELGWVNGSGTRIITGCVAHPTAGAMGYHYFNEQLMDDLAVDLLQPEVLVYAPGPDGQLRLVAVEWVARARTRTLLGCPNRPACLGCRCTSSSRRSGSTSCTPGCGSPTRQGCSRTGTPTSPAPRSELQAVRLAKLARRSPNQAGCGGGRCGRSPDPHPRRPRAQPMNPAPACASATIISTRRSLSIGPAPSAAPHASLCGHPLPTRPQ